MRSHGRMLSTPCPLQVLAIGQAMYGSQPGAGPAGGPEGAAGAPGADEKKGGDNVVDAEFTDSDK